MFDFEAARIAMVDRQVRPSDVTRYPIIDAMLSVPREKFAPRDLRDVCYADEHIPLAEGRVMLAPRTFAKMLEAAEIGPDDTVLDVACGSGYSTAILSRMCAAVIGVEPLEELADQASAALVEIDALNAVVLAADPTKGDPDNGPYDAIIVNGGAEQGLSALARQLRDGGRLVAIRSEGPARGRCVVLTRTGDSHVERAAFDASAPVIPGFERIAAFEF